MSPHLTITQKRILERILQKEHGASTAQINFALYGAFGQPERSAGNIAVQVAKMRPMLAGLGIHIITTGKFTGLARYVIAWSERAHALKYLTAEAHRLAEPIKTRISGCAVTKTGLEQSNVQ